ncbi:MAG: TRIC cation channel family protein, partial [Paracoccaceae bacterium]
MPEFTLLDGLDYASVLVFALTGALAASRSQLDIVGFVFIACLTAVGGGTI